MSDDGSVMAVCKWCRDGGKTLSQLEVQIFTFTRHETKNPEHTILVLGMQDQQEVYIRGRFSEAC